MPSVFVGQGAGEGEMSMDLETESEGSDSHIDDGGAMYQNVAFVEAQEPEQDGEGEDVDMDVTQVIYGGIVPRLSLPANTSITSEMSVQDTNDGEEEKTMDFTIAIGGLLPHSPPVGAVFDRYPIGYSVPMSPNSASRRLIPGQLMDGEVEIDIDETVAIGGIIGADESLSSGTGSAEDTFRERTMTFSFGDVRAAANGDDAMEMAIATGGILGLPSHAPATLTQPMSGAPSFAKPTVSSLQKEKRNIFAPSPSPYKTTPRKSGMDTAGEVAKRLSFGSTTSSGGNKRPMGEDENTANSKRVRMDSADGVFGSTVIGGLTPRKSLPNAREGGASPRKSLGTPMRTTKSPARSPALRRMLGEKVQSGEPKEQEWDQAPTISLAAFLEMAGVQFLEGLSGLTRRRSSVARGVLGQSYSNVGE